MNGTTHGSNAASSGIPGSPVISDVDGEDAFEDHAGDYSTRLEELMSDEDGDETAAGIPGDEDGEENEEGFIYNGVDSEPTGTYRDQLRDVLGPEHEEDEFEQQGGQENSIIHDIEEKERYEAAMDDEARVRVDTSPQPCFRLKHCAAVRLSL